MTIHAGSLNIDRLPLGWANLPRVVREAISFADDFLDDFVDLSKPNRGTSIMTFMSTHSSWPRIVKLYENETRPISFAPNQFYRSPRSTTIYGFRVNENAEITSRGQDGFLGCRTEEQKDPGIFKIFWRGGGAAPIGTECRAVPLRKELNCILTCDTTRANCHGIGC